MSRVVRWIGYRSVLRQSSPRMGVCFGRPSSSARIFWSRRSPVNPCVGMACLHLRRCALPWHGTRRNSETLMAFKQRVFSGMQASGNPHLGNYLGAIKRWVEMQTQVDCIYCVVDLHAITTWQDPAELPRATRDVVASFMAAGLDPKRNILFNQSQAHEHAELAWVFNCVARIGWMNRMTQFKEKSGKDRENASLGLYAYPTLMAADILLYHPTMVPVGEDQKQHVELTRDIAQKFNHDYADSIRRQTGKDVFFPLPEPLIQGEATRVMRDRKSTRLNSSHVALSRMPSSA